MNGEKRMAGEYEITQAIHIGDKEVVFGIDENNANNGKYLCSYYKENALFSEYYESMIGDDYVEIMKLFADRLSEQCDRVQKERGKVTVPTNAITPEQCIPNDYKKSIEGKVVVIRAEALRPEYQSADRQLWLCTGGFGSHANSRGSACSCINLFTGKSSRWERYDIQGEIKPEFMPDWAKERLAVIQAERTTQKREYTEKEAR